MNVKRIIGVAIIVAFHVGLMIVVARDMGAWWWGPVLVLAVYAAFALLMLGIVWGIGDGSPPRRRKRRGRR